MAASKGKHAVELEQKDISLPDLADIAMAGVAMTHAAFSKNYANGDYCQPRRWIVRFADEAGNLVKEGTYQQNWCVEGESYLQPRESTSTSIPSGMVIPACLQVTPDTTSRSNRKFEKGCYCYGKIGHKMKRCPYNK